MYRNILAVVLGTAVLFVLGAGCGSPEVSATDSLEVVFLPLAGARDVALDVTPKVYFNGEVDGTSVTDASVYLKSATLSWDPEEQTGDCEGAWSSVDGQASAEDSVVTFTPDADLADTTCYRLTCTTAVSGSELGPLRALPCNPDEKDSCRRDVGAEQTFWTIIVED
jgi:hypothetical protein